jgi:SAM-dependent methyltransferase
MQVRKSSYLQDASPTLLDQFGMLLTKVRLNNLLRKKNCNVFFDVGCGFDASLTKSIWEKFDIVYLADIKLNKVLQAVSHAKVVLLEGALPNSIRRIPDNSVDIVFANNVIEHMEKPSELITELRRVTKSSSIIYINVPSWTGKIFLELAAFRLGLASKIEMQDHRNYYDRKSLWTLVRSSGVEPSKIKIRRTKFGLNVTCWIDNDK